jgi:adenine-specific DNA-methyltransferase
MSRRAAASRSSTCRPSPTRRPTRSRSSVPDRTKAEVNVDLLETFNWLIGLTVRHIAAPQALRAAFERDSEKRLRLKGRLKQEAGGPHWFRTVTGTTPDGRRTLIILIYVNGGNNLENLKTPHDLWKVRLIEEDFHRLMFDTEGA